METVDTTEQFLTLDEKRKMLKAVFGTNVLRIEFTKKDGSKREMVCTLRGDLIPEDKKPGDNQLPLPFDKSDVELIEKKTRKTNPSVFSVYDLENNGWRSFIVDNLIDFNVIEDYGKDQNRIPGQ